MSEAVLVRWRHLIEDGRKRGHTFSQPDVLIAATAAEAELIVVTRDIDEFIQANVPVFDPWNGVVRDATGLSSPVTPKAALQLVDPIQK